jgi:hypothetical protein
MTRMTENYPPADPQWTEPLVPGQEQPSAAGPPSSAGRLSAAGPSSAAGPQSTTDVIRDQAADLGGSTVQAGKQTAGVAREQASGVMAEATRQGRNLLQEAQGQVGQQVAQGQHRLASELLSISDQLLSMADSSKQDGTASELARQVATRARDAGQWLEARQPADVVDELQSFARRRPGMFLAIAAGAGLIAGRLTRGLKDASSGNGSPAGDVWTGAGEPYGAGAAAEPYGAGITREPYGTGTAAEPYPAGTGAEPYVEETYVAEETYIAPEPPFRGDRAGREGT